MSFQTTMNQLWSARLGSLGFARKPSRLRTAAKLVSAGAVGALLGAAITALLTPTSGAKARAKLIALARPAAREASMVNDDCGAPVSLHEAQS